MAFKGRCVNPDVMLAGLAIPLVMTTPVWHANVSRYARQAAAAASAVPYARNDPSSPEFYIEVSAACELDFMGAATWCALHLRHLERARAHVP